MPPRLAIGSSSAPSRRKYPVPRVSDSTSVIDGRGYVNDADAANAQLTAGLLGTTFWIGWSGSIVMPSASAVPTMTPIMMVVRWASNCFPWARTRASKMEKRILCKTGWPALPD